MASCLKREGIGLAGLIDIIHTSHKSEIFIWDKDCNHIETGQSIPELVKWMGAIHTGVHQINYKVNHMRKGYIITPFKLLKIPPTMAEILCLLLMATE